MVCYRFHEEKPINREKAVAGQKANKALIACRQSDFKELAWILKLQHSYLEH